jgi:hypothetical protein
MSTVHHQEYLDTVYTQKLFVSLVLLVSASELRILTRLAGTNRTRMTNSFCVVYSVEILLIMDSGQVRNI